MCLSSQSYDSKQDSRMAVKEDCSTDISSVCGGDEELAVAVAVPFDSDEEAQAQAAVTASREAGIATIRNHCEHHLISNPTSTYVTWIATLHPENAHVTIDSRFLIPGNPWLVIWEELHKQEGEDNVLVTPTAPPAEDNNNDGDVVMVPSKRKFEGSLLDFIIGNALVLVSVAYSLVFELVAAYCYLSYWLCTKIMNMCGSPHPNMWTILPFAVTYLIGSIFQLLDAVLLVTSTIVVESVAAVNYIIVTILSLSHTQGKMMHQKTRKLSHIARWAFRQSLFQDWNPPRSNFNCCGSEPQVEENDVTE